MSCYFAPLGPDTQPCATPDVTAISLTTVSPSHGETVVKEIAVTSGVAQGCLQCSVPSLRTAPLQDLLDVGSLSSAAQPT